MRQITTGDGKVITLNDEQNEALLLMDDWFHDSNEQFFTLAGYAGTGKTTIVKEFLDTSCRTTSVAVTAPTHKAKNVIAKSTGRPGTTLQALMGIGVDTKIENFDPENPQFVQKRTPDFTKFKLIVVDESSMINKALLKALLLAAKRFRVKVLFMGDKAQLPPVNELVSEVFVSDEITYKYQLTKVERQDGGNPLMPMYDNFRNNLSNPNPGVEKVTNLNEKGEGYRFIRLHQFTNDIAERYKDPLFDPASLKVLCWTNDEVHYWNKFIREKRMAALHGDTPIGIIFPGDILVSTATRGDFINSEEYLVKECSLDKVEFNKGEQFGETLTVTIPLIKATVKVISTGEERTLHVLNSKDPKAVMLWREVYFYEHGKAMASKKWQSFMDFRSKAILVAPVGLGSGRSIPPDLDYGYALTVHKSQGSTYEEVFIHKDIWRNPNVVERNQLKYVASSRPTKVAHFLL